MTKQTNEKLAEAWATITAAIEANEPAGEIVIPSGKGTNLYVRVKPSRVPLAVGLECVRQGFIKPLTDISLNKETDEGNWKFPHERRLKKVELWYSGDYAAKGGGVPDPVSAQMREELVAELKAKGLTAKVMAEKGIKGTVGQMLDALIAGGAKVDKAATMERLRATATARLAERGKAAGALDLSSLEI